MDACQYSGLETLIWGCIETVSSKAARLYPFYNDNVNITKEYLTSPKFQQHKNGSRMDLSELHICTHTYACQNRVRPQWSNGILLVKLTPRFHCGIPTLEMPGTRKSLRHKYYFFIPVSRSHAIHRVKWRTSLPSISPSSGFLYDVNPSYEQHYEISRFPFCHSLPTKPL